MKQTAKNIVVHILGWQVRRLTTKNTFKIIVVGGSIGKTSTKLAIAKVLSQQYQVRTQEGNYNDIVSIPLVFFGLTMPSLMNPFAWIMVFYNIERQLMHRYPYDYVVLELGTDAPGQIAAFNQYIHAQLGIITAITPEHMEHFSSMTAVANEEVKLVDLCDQVLYNADLCDQQYFVHITKPLATYALSQQATYQVVNPVRAQTGIQADITRNNKPFLHIHTQFIAAIQLYTAAAAVAVSDLMGVKTEHITAGVQALQPFNGRMQLLNGINNSQIIDETYNASPVAVKAALDTLYQLPSPQKIAILGNMNELGSFSQQAHTEIGEHCDPKQLALVVTIGEDANKYLAPAAKQKGCQVVSFNSPYEIANYLKPLIKPQTIILAKGSQNGVFAEEAIKLLLANPADTAKLVRQSPDWLAIKQKIYKQS